MNTVHTLIESVIHSIDWRRIKSFHKKLGIKWVFEFNEQKIERLPTVSELRGDLRNMLEHMYSEKLTYISYGNWIIFWDALHKENGDIRVIFRLSDYVFENHAKENLELALDKAIENEDYEYAAMIRDEINKEKQLNGK
jgi:hypothetical protein